MEEKVQIFKKSIDSELERWFIRTIRTLGILSEATASGPRTNMTAYKFLHLHFQRNLILYSGFHGY